MNPGSVADRKVQFTFGAAIALLLLVGAFSYRTLLASNESNQWVQHTYEVLGSLQDLVLGMETVSSSTRRFVITGEESDLDAFRAAKSNIARLEPILRNLMSDNPQQQRKLPAIETLIAERLQRSEEIINLRRDRGIEAAADAVREERTLRTAVDIKELSDQLRGEELRLLALREVDLNRHLVWTKTLLVLGTLLGLMIAAGAAWSMERNRARRKLAEEALRRSAEEMTASEARFRGLLEAAPDAMMVVNQGGEIVLLNLQAEKQFGYRRDELLGQPVKSIIPEGLAERRIVDDRRSAEDTLAQQNATGIEFTARRKDGSIFPVEIMLSPLEGPEGILVTAAIRDISLRKTAEAQVKELNRSNGELAQFAYIASHDLQEPLRMVASYTQLLAKRYKGKLDSDADEFIAFAVDGATRMQRLIQDLLAYSRVGTSTEDLLDISSEAALEQALANLRGAIEDSGAKVTHDPLPIVLANEMQLIQLFQNLIGNAIKYQSPGVPRVHICAAMDGKKSIFSVEDNGLGIDPQYFERIFGVFQRLHKREEFAGTGIGLAICKKIVERHDGSIWVVSQPGKGSTFRFTLAASRRTS